MVKADLGHSDPAPRGVALPYFLGLTCAIYSGEDGEESHLVVGIGVSAVFVYIGGFFFFFSE